MRLTVRFILICCLLVLASRSLFAAGEFQQARDGKTMIWNWQPKAGETASWSGDRDKENYANGFGDLTWYNADGKVFGLFYGNMNHGKFEGAVNVHTGNRVAHAYFVNGERVTAWARGGAKSTMTAPVAAVVEKKKAEAEKEIAKEKENVARAEPVTTPTPKKEKPQTIVKSEPVPSPTSKPARGPETYHKETIEKPPTVVEQKSSPPQVEEPKSESSIGSNIEPTPVPNSETSKASQIETTQSTTNVSQPAPSESPQASIEDTPPVLHRPVAEEKSEIAEQPPGKPEITQEKSEINREPPKAPPAKETPPDVSLNALVGPPSSLRTNPIPEKSSETKPSAATPKPDGPLTEADAISLADNEMRSEGLDTDNYDRPKADHSAVKGKWTLFYMKKSGASSDTPAAVSATVEDNSHKVEIKK